MAASAPTFTTVATVFARVVRVSTRLGFLRANCWAAIPSSSSSLPAAKQLYGGVLLHRRSTSNMASVASVLGAKAAAAGAHIIAQPAGRHVSIGFIGAGQMAESMAKSWQVCGVVPPSCMVCTDVSMDRRRLFESFGIASMSSCREVAEKSDVLILSVKPPGVRPALAELRPYLEERHLIVSIAAGITLASMQEWAGPTVRIVRVMPNVACLVAAAASAVSIGAKAKPEDGALVRALFAAMGSVAEVPEALLDAVTGLSGSGPAYVFMLIEAMADGGVAAGLPRDTAVQLAAQTTLGAAKMCLESGKHPAQLKDSVASPAGTTIAALHELEKSGFRGSIMTAVLAATKRSKELSK